MVPNEHKTMKVINNFEPFECSHHTCIASDIDMLSYMTYIKAS